MTTPTQSADALALVAKWKKRAESLNYGGNKSREELLVECADELQAAISSLAAHRGGVEPVAFRVRLNGSSGEWRLCNGSIPEVTPGAYCYQPLYLHPPQAQAGAGDAYFQLLLKATDDANAKACASGGFNNIDEVVPFIWNRFDQLKAEAKP